MDIQDLLLVIRSELSLTHHLHHNTAQAQKEGIAQSHLAIVIINIAVQKLVVASKSVFCFLKNKCLFIASYNYKVLITSLLD